MPRSATRTASKDSPARCRERPFPRLIRKAEAAVREARPQRARLTGKTARKARVPGREPPDFLRQSYGDVSPDGAGHYEVIVAKLAAMHAHEPALTHDDLAKITCRTLVMIADDDEVRLEHAVDLYRSLPDAELAVVPGTSHGLLVEKPELCNMVITEFFTKDPIPTFAPIRRAAPRRERQASRSP